MTTPSKLSPGLKTVPEVGERDIRVTLKGTGTRVNVTPIVGLMVGTVVEVAAVVGTTYCVAVAAWVAVAGTLVSVGGTVVALGVNAASAVIWATIVPAAAVWIALTSAVGCAAA